MSTLVLKGMPIQLHKNLKAQAKSHRRSVTQEAIGILDMHVTPHRVVFDGPPMKLKKPLNGDEIVRIIREGRDR